MLTSCITNICNYLPSFLLLFLKFVIHDACVKKRNLKVQNIKETYSNICMKICITSKLTQHLSDIYKMRFLMRNCFKCTQQCKHLI